TRGIFIMTGWRALIAGLAGAVSMGLATAGSAQTQSPKVIILTSGSTWTVPADWSSIHTIECIGGGGGGARTDVRQRYRAGGGGGGGYSKVTNQTYTPGMVISFTVGAAGAGATTNNTPGGAGGDTFIRQSDNLTVACLAKGGQGGGVLGGLGAGGAAAS